MRLMRYRRSGFDVLHTRIDFGEIRNKHRPCMLRRCQIERRGFQKNRTNHHGVIFHPSDLRRVARFKSGQVVWRSACVSCCKAGLWTKP